MTEIAAKTAIIDALAEKHRGEVAQGPGDLLLARGCLVLQLVPCNLDTANAFVRRLHRHHPPVIAHKFSVGVVDETNEMRGIATVGIPKARMSMDGWTLEVNRVCTDGAKNACSMLYGACWRAAQAMGYRRLVTYTLPEEGGASLRASGWTHLGERGGGSWGRKNRPRVSDGHPLGVKWGWEKLAIGYAAGWPLPSVEEPVPVGLFAEEAK